MRQAKRATPEGEDVPGYGLRQTSAPEGTPLEVLLRFAGTIDPEEGRRMQEAIEDECERVDPRDWE